MTAWIIACNMQIVCLLKIVIGIYLVCSQRIYIINQQYIFDNDNIIWKM